MRKDIDYKVDIDDSLLENLVREEIEFLTIVLKK
jgi:hypothetical protein